MLVIDFTEPFGWPWFIASIILMLAAASILFIAQLAEWKHITIASFAAIVIGVTSALYATLWVVRLGTILLL